MNAIAALFIEMGRVVSLQNQIIWFKNLIVWLLYPLHWVHKTPYHSSYSKLENWIL